LKRGRSKSATSGVKKTAKEADEKLTQANKKVKDAK